MTWKLDTMTKKISFVTAALTLMAMLVTGGASGAIWLIDMQFVSEDEIAEELSVWKQELTGNYVDKDTLEFQFRMLQFDQREAKLLDAIKRINIKESLETLTSTDKALRASWQAELLEVQQQRQQYLQSIQE